LNVTFSISRITVIYNVIRGRKPLSPTEVEMTKGYNLGCKYVLHGALISPWNEQV
jgi:hypothetical protein